MAEVFEDRTDLDKVLKEEEAARLLSVSQRTLQGFRLRGGGPLFVRIGGRIGYRRRDLINFLEANVARSTSK